MHIDDLPHGVGFGKFDVVEKTAAQKRVGQFFFIVRGDEHQRSGVGLNQLAGLVSIKLHAVELAQQVVGEFNVRFINFIYQERHRFSGGEGLPQHTFDDVVFNVLDAFTAI